jgi:hypothetical protein
MASLVLSGDTSGSITVSAPAISGSNTQTLVATTGTLAPIVSGTAVASTSGTSIDFTSIPSWVKRITVMLSGVSTNGTSNPLIQLGDAGGIEATGYSATSTNQSGTVASYTTGFGVNNASASVLLYGNLTFTLISASSFLWSMTGAISLGAGGGSYYVAGSKALSDTLTQVRITTETGTNTFDAGTINILYE